MSRQSTLFDSARMTLWEALMLTAQSLTAYGSNYEHWAIAFSGGKDSSATVAAVIYLITHGHVPRPKTLTILMSDTRMEMPPLFECAMRILSEVKALGFEVRVVLPVMEDRFFVYVLGRGVPPPSNTFRWCTGQLKVEPMVAARSTERAETV